MMKPYCIMANFSLAASKLRCREGVLQLLPGGWTAPETMAIHMEEPAPQPILAPVVPQTEFKDGPSLPALIPGTSANVDTDALKLDESQRLHLRARMAVNPRRRMSSGWQRRGRISGIKFVPR